jgi:hypothetical protein
MSAHYGLPIHSLRGLTITLLVYNMSSALLSLDFIDVFQMTGLLRRTFYQNEKETKYVSIYLDTDNLKPYV